MEMIFLVIALVFYLVSAILRLLPVKKQYSDWFLLLAGLSHLGLLITRSVIAKHPPFTNIYETFLLLPFLIFLRIVFWPKRHVGSYGMIMTFISAAFLTVALILPADIKTPKPLMPALNSIWMYIHVPAYFFAYMALIAALVYAVMVLTKKDHAIGETAKRLDEELKIAFFFLNVGLVTGAVWAYVSWGNYWSWDPKETWALINVLVLSYVFHLKIPNPQKKAWILIIAVLTVAFTYWGVTYILSGLHSYT
ncbi:MAG: cytochrome c biogenesis protein CcsA [Candidatus Marinimicrobia bacterium]|nr:cytochrome c biogenesis protein CcsA [Candidatus Neomarinimicrobiota bacterium]